MVGYVVELVPIGGRRWAGVPPEVRLRRALRAMLRSYGLRARTVGRRDG